MLPLTETALQVTWLGDIFLGAVGVEGGGGVGLRAADRDAAAGGFDVERGEAGGRDDLRGRGSGDGGELRGDGDGGRGCVGRRGWRGRVLLMGSSVVLLELQVTLWVRSAVGCVGVVAGGGELLGIAAGDAGGGWGDGDRVKGRCGDDAAGGGLDGLVGGGDGEGAGWRRG